MEILMFYIKRKLLGINAQLIDNIQRSSDLVLSEENTARQFFLFNDTRYTLIDLYSFLFHKDSCVSPNNDYIILLKNHYCLNCDRMEKIFFIKIYKLNYLLMNSQSYANLYSGAFLFDNKIGLVLNLEKLVNVCPV